MKIINKILGTRYWYNVKFIYKNKEKERIFDFQGQVGLIKRSEVFNQRRLSNGVELHKFKNLKPWLCNGFLSVEITTYLGWFKWKK